MNLVEEAAIVAVVALEPREKCIKQRAVNVAMSVKCLLSQVKAAQCTAEIVSETRSSSKHDSLDYFFLFLLYFTEVFRFVVG